LDIADARIEYDADGLPRVNGVIPAWRIAKKTPVCDASGVIVDYDCELEPTNEAARIMVQISAVGENRGAGL
jgi:hypothetical protein